MTLVDPLQNKGQRDTRKLGNKSAHTDFTSRSIVDHMHLVANIGGSANVH